MLRSRWSACCQRPCRVSYADAMTIVPHFAARIEFKKDYFEVMGVDRWIVLATSEDAVYLKKRGLKLRLT